MSENKLPEEIDSVLSQVRLKEPPENILNKFNAEIDGKIEHALKASHGVRISLALSAVALLAVFVALYLMYAAHNRAMMAAAPSWSAHPPAAPIKQSVTKSVSLERELETLEILDPDFDNELFELAGDEYFPEDYSSFDEAEFSAVGLQNSLVR